MRRSLAADIRTRSAQGRVGAEMDREGDTGLRRQRSPHTHTHSHSDIHKERERTSQQTDNSPRSPEGSQKFQLVSALFPTSQSENCLLVFIFYNYHHQVVRFYLYREEKRQEKKEKQNQGKNTLMPNKGPCVDALVTGLKDQ